MATPRVNFERLMTAVDWSTRQLETPRKNRVDAVRQFVGSHYADGGSERRMPVNMLELAVTIYVRQLAARAPRVMASTRVTGLRPFAKTLELVLNQIPDEINLGATIRRAVVEAIFGVGIVKVGISAGGQVVEGYDSGEPFCDLVSLDDYFCDMSAKSRAGLQFEGNDYWLPHETAKELFGDAMAGVESDSHTVTGDNGEERAEGVSTDEGADLYRDKVWLRDVWLPDSQQVVTYGVKSRRLFRVVDWDGPETGPYHVLGFSDVPGNLLPLPPVALWLDLNELGNSIFRKLAKQADAKKTVAAFAGGNDDDVHALQRAADGEGIKYNGQKPEQITVGGIDAPTLAFFIQTRDLFSYFGGNLDTLGGLAPMTDTVGQDRLLSDAASARVNYMRDQTIDFVKGIFRSLAWYVWTDPVRERVVEKRVKGTDIGVSVAWSPETRDGDFLDYNIDIDVYSMQDDTPSLRLQKIGMALERFVFPALPLIQQQGGQIDFRKLMALVAQLGNTPELEDIITFGEPPEGVPQQGGSGQPTIGKPAHTTRTYERVNRPGATRAGKDDVLSRLLMGGGVQGAEAATVGRSVS